jgi:hypothetical protein
MRVVYVFRRSQQEGYQLSISRHDVFVSNCEAGNNIVIGFAAGLHLNLQVVDEGVRMAVQANRWQPTCL